MRHTVSAREVQGTEAMLRKLRTDAGIPLPQRKRHTVRELRALPTLTTSEEGYALKIAHEDIRVWLKHDASHVLVMRWLGNRWEEHDEYAPAA